MCSEHSVVDTDTVNLFKAHLVKFWLHQNVRYNFMVDLTRSSNRSIDDINVYYSFNCNFFIILMQTKMLLVNTCNHCAL